MKPLRLKTIQELAKPAKVSLEIECTDEGKGAGNSDEVIVAGFALLGNFKFLILNLSLLDSPLI